MQMTTRDENGQTNELLIGLKLADNVVGAQSLMLPSSLVSAQLSRSQ